MINSYFLFFWLWFYYFRNFLNLNMFLLRWFWLPKKLSSFILIDHHLNSRVNIIYVFTKYIPISIIKNTGAYLNHQVLLINSNTYIDIGRQYEFCTAKTFQCLWTFSFCVLFNLIILHPFLEILVDASDYLLVFLLKFLYLFM